MKYIVTDKRAFAIFSETQTHADMARGMWGEPVGAGFCRLEEGKYKCWGQSISLHLKSREEDEKVINLEIEE